MVGNGVLAFAATAVMASAGLAPTSASARWYERDRYASATCTAITPGCIGIGNELNRDVRYGKSGRHRPRS
jgi:hypothetical protein